MKCIVNNSFSNILKPNGSSHISKLKNFFFSSCYSSGERLCRRQAVQFGFSQDDIDQCGFCLKAYVHLFLTRVADLVVFRYPRWEEVGTKRGNARKNFNDTGVFLHVIRLNMDQIGLKWAKQKYLYTF